MKLIKVHAGFYKTEDGTITVSKYEGRSWSGSRGAYAFTEWTATLRSAVGPEMDAAKAENRQSNDGAYLIAKAAKFEDLKKRLVKYLDDRAAGTLGTRHRYGFSLDQRPVAR